jgi:FeS assembly protein IscX
MGLKWTDTREIAIELCENLPDVNPISVRFTDLHRWVMGLPDFDDKPEHSGEKILEAIQMAWMEEHGD